jgi:16S rRNA (cytidine1402-2'-O)-methyltransferase
LSGYSDDYYFYGFLRKKLGERKKAYEQFSNIDSSIILFLPARNLVSLIQEMQQYLGDRNILIGKELTKIHETVIKGNLSNIIEKIKLLVLKGEITIVLSSETNKNKEQNIDLNKEILDLSKKMTTSDISKYLSKKLNISKKDIYKQILNLKNKK